MECAERSCDFISVVVGDGVFAVGFFAEVGIDILNRFFAAIRVGYSRCVCAYAGFELPVERVAAK